MKTEELPVLWDVELFENFEISLGNGNAVDNFKIWNSLSSQFVKWSESQNDEPDCCNIGVINSDEISVVSNAEEVNLLIDISTEVVVLILVELLISIVGIIEDPLKFFSNRFAWEGVATGIVW